MRSAYGDLVSNLDNYLGYSKVAVLLSPTVESFALLSLALGLESPRVDYIIVDRGMDFPWLRFLLFSLTPSAQVYRPPLKQSPYYLIFRRGYLPPHSTFRWYTRLFFDTLPDLSRYDYVLMGSNRTTLNPKKRFIVKYEGDFGVSYSLFPTTKTVFPFAKRDHTFLLEMIAEHFPDVVKFFSLGARGGCMFCVGEEYERTAEIARDIGVFGASRIYALRRYFLTNAFKSSNRVIDEKGYPRGLNLDFRIRLYSRMKFDFLYLNDKVPGYLPDLSPFSPEE